MKWHTVCIVLNLCLCNFLDARLYFMHVPKTAGTSLRLLLEQQLSVDEIYPYRNQKSAVAPVEQELVSGHFSYWFCKRLDAHFEEAFKVTILRDPVERYLSYLRAKKKADTTMKDLEAVLHTRLETNGIYKEELVDNYLCRYLAQDPELEGEALLESAKETLRACDCVIFFDHLSEDVIDLFRRLGINLSENEIPKINVTEPVPVKAKLLKEVRRLNELDMQLYEYAKSHLPKKTTEYRLRTAAKNVVSHRIDYTFDLPLKGSGWTYREVDDENSIYRWVMDRPAEIYFSLLESVDYLLQFNAKCVTSKVTPQVHVNGRQVSLLRVNEEPFSLYQGIIRKEWLSAAPVKISFSSNIAFQYREIYPMAYNRNHPPLSFAINRIQISERE